MLFVHVGFLFIFCQNLSITKRTIENQTLFKILVFQLRLTNADNTKLI